MVPGKYNMNRLFNRIIAILIQYKWILIILFAISFVHNLSKISIEIELNTDSNNSFSIYWGEKGSYYHESRKIKFPIYKDKYRYRVSLNLLFKNIHEFRIDPLISEGRIAINKIVIKDKYFKPIIFDKKSDFEKFIPLNDVKSVTYDNNQMIIESGGKDPYLAMSLLNPSFDLKSFVKIILSAFVFSALISIATIVFLVIVNSTLFRESYYRYTIIAMLLFVLSLILIMAFVSTNYSHPDERVHFKAAEYYFDYWMPPAIGDKRVEGTYSAYGVSRLYSLTPLYLLAGKIANLLNFVINNRIICVRLFDVMLFMIIGALVLSRAEMNYVSIFVFISPQIWYIFSYINDDAFPLFISFLLFYQIAFKRSIFNEFINSKEHVKSLYGAIWFGILLGILLISKKNYYSIWAFICAYLFLDMIFSMHKKHLLLKYCIVVIISVLIFSGRMYYNQMINDFDIPSKTKILEKYKREQFKSNAAPEKKYYAYHLKEKGVKFTELITSWKWNWHTRTFDSFVGNYGYLNIYSKAAFYKIYLLAYISFIITLIFVTFKHFPIRERLLSLLVLSLSILLILASLYHSWVVDFQAQGRYLFPIVIMFCFLFDRIKGKIGTRILNYYTIIFFCLSSYSFVITALGRIPKG